jgi:hypothetical protein
MLDLRRITVIRTPSFTIEPRFGGPHEYREDGAVEESLAARDGETTEEFHLRVNAFLGACARRINETRAGPGAYAPIRLYVPET